jgi:ribonucleoside-diphosphate reductase beta chain
VLAGYGHLLAAGRRLQWDVDAIALDADRARWRSADRGEREDLSALLAGFWVAEHQVAEQLAPFIARADGAAREAFALQAGDERRHAAFFDRALGEVVGLDPERDARSLADGAILQLFDVALPVMASALADGKAEPSDAVALYHIVLEAIVLSTGQAALMERVAGAYPGLADGVARIEADERWHIGLGVHAFGEGGVAPGCQLDALAERAASAWGPRVATPERMSRMFATHRRRAALLTRAVLSRRDTED